MENTDYFGELYAVDVSEHVEQKNNLSYLSWAWAWAEVKKRHPDATYTIYENKDGWNYHTDGRTCWVKTGVTVNGIEHIEYLPVMDFRNSSILLERVTSYDVNKAIQRSLTKAVARHGLGLYIYAGEDLPEGAEDTAAGKQAAPKKNAPQEAPAAPESPRWAECLGILAGTRYGRASIENWIGAHCGAPMPLDDLNEEQYGALVTALRKAAAA